VDFQWVAAAFRAISARLRFPSAAARREAAEIDITVRNSFAGQALEKGCGLLLLRREVESVFGLFHGQCRTGSGGQSMNLPARHRQNAFKELAIVFEGGVLGGLIVSGMHVARKGNAGRSA
jgi:hypothetical protein